MASKPQPRNSESKRRGYMIGVYVGLAMIALTAIEYLIGTSASPSVVFLFLISIAKSVLVIYFFMHIYRLWRTEGSH